MVRPAWSFHSSRASSSRNRSPSRQRQESETRPCAPDVLAVAFYVEHVLRYLILYYILLQVWKSRFFVVLLGAAYVYILYVRGDLTRRNVTRHSAFAQLVGSQLAESGRWLHVLSLLMTEVAMSFFERWAEPARAEERNAIGTGFTPRRMQTSAPVVTFGPLWERVSGGFNALFHNQLAFCRRDIFGLSPGGYKSDWKNDEERELFTAFLVDRYGQTSESELRLDCPITKEIMRHPVVAADGFSYEASAMRHWLQVSKGPPRSPITGEILGHTNLIPNNTLKGIIESHLEEFREIRKHSHTPQSTNHRRGAERF